MRFAFDERKAGQMAARLLRAAGGRRDVIELVKLMYLCDRQALIDRGLPITGAYMVSMRWGPVLSEVLDEINLGKRPGDGSDWQQYVTQRDHNSVAVASNVECIDRLSRYEIRVIDQVIDKYGHTPKWDLVSLTHELPEWRDPGRSSNPIDPEDILRAAGRTEEDVRVATEHAESLWFLNTVNTPAT